MSRYVSDSLRQLVAERASYRCEYCGLPQNSAFFSFHIDHVVSIKHGGTTSTDNLALSCQICNLNKGSDIATYLEGVPEPVRFYNPRVDKWKEHFEIEKSGFLRSKTLIAQATIKILGLNHPDSIIERRELVELGFFE